MWCVYIYFLCYAFLGTSKVMVAYVNLTIKTRQYTNHFLLLLKIQEAQAHHLKYYDLGFIKG